MRFIRLFRAGRRLAVQQVLDLVTAQGFELKEAFSHRRPLVAILRHDLASVIHAFLDQLANLFLDLFRRLFRNVRLVHQLLAEENVALIVGIVDRADLG